MIENTQILLIDDDEESSRDLRTVLAFLGESVIASNSTAWKIQVEESGLKSSQFSAAGSGINSRLIPHGFQINCLGL
ncbi:MAG: hypothetical protein JKY29_13145, partial [Gammaproteobacteria bacterium]|nr:hypothetical protein [Gammaproteobacteria bacterium]